jgi:hypothetical protein
MSTWRSPWAVVAVIGLLALLGVGVATVMFSHWTTLRAASPPQAAQAFAAVQRRVASWGVEAGQPYLHVDAQGQVLVERRLEHDPPAQLQALHLLAWDPASQQLLDVSFPWWFVRLKMNDTINLGTFTTALSGDWHHLDLTVSTGELRRRGPGIVLDHVRADSTRILLWSEPREAP